MSQPEVPPEPKRSPPKVVTTTVTDAEPTEAEAPPTPADAPPKRPSVTIKVQRPSRDDSIATSNLTADQEEEEGDEDGQGKKRGSHQFKPSRYKSMLIDELPPCRMFRTRSSLDYIQNRIDEPRVPMKYIPPYRRNFRYFGYPQDLNLEINTPPRVKSWGSITQPAPKTNKHKRRTPSQYNFQATPDASFDPHWMGRLLKHNLLLENPGLLPPADKAHISMGQSDKLQLVHPEFMVHNCPSDLYFPITDDGRKAFCKINKFIQDKIDRHIRAYQVQNPTVMKYVANEKTMLQNEPENKRETGQDYLRAKRRTTLKTSQIPISISMATSEEKIIYDFDPTVVTPVMKTMCTAAGWPGLNRQLYERPREKEDTKGISKHWEEEKLIYGGPKVAEFKINISEEIWQKLARVRQRQKELERNLEKRLKVNDPDFGRFRTFSQLELRDEVMTKARFNFMDRLKEDLDTPLPPELFQDNRELYQPPHDFEEAKELPAQGPFWWKERKEAPATEEEMEIVERFVADAKTRRSYTHHLPGLLHAPRHPFQPIELDWMEKGAEMARVQEARKTPEDLKDMPAYIASLGKQSFKKKFKSAVKEGAKELVGKEIWDLYKRTYGIVETEERGDEEDEVEGEMKGRKEAKPKVKKYRLKKRQEKKVELVTDEKWEVVKPKEQEFKFDVEELIPEEKEEEGEEEEQDEEEEEEPEVQKVATKSMVELEPEYRLSQDLLEDPEYPLPNINFDDIEFPGLSKIPEEYKEELRNFFKNMLSGEPVTKQEEELKEEDDSDTTTDSEVEGMEKDREQPKMSHDAVPHLQNMYQEAVLQKMKKKSVHGHRPMPQSELEPPKLKDVFLKETYVEDINQILHENDKLPSFLKLF